MSKELMKNFIAEMICNLDLDKIESINVENGFYDDKQEYTDVTINYVKGGENE